MAEQKKSNNAFSKAEALHAAWKLAKKNFWFFAAMIIIPYAIYWPLSFLTQSLTSNANMLVKIMGILITIVGWIVNVELSFAKLAIYFKITDKKKTNLKDLIAYFDARLLYRFVIITAAYSLLCFIGGLFFIVPGVYFATKYWFAPYIVVAKGTGIKEAFSESAKLTEGIKWQLLLLGILQVLIEVAGVIALLVGLLIAIPVNHLSDIYVYRKLSSKKA